MLGKGAQVEKGLKERLQGMLRPIVVIQKKDQFRLWYKPDRRKRQRSIEEKRQNRIASFLGKEKESAKMNIPRLSSSFLLVGFINPEMIQGNEKEMMANVTKTFGSLSIDMVEVEDQEASNTGLPPFPQGQILETVVELPVVFKLSNE